MRALFITWDGSQQTYLESLFLPIFARLAARGVNVEVLQFTWGSARELDATRDAAARFGVAYSSRPISRRWGLVGNVATIARGAAELGKIVRQRGIDVLFPRSLMPASMTLLAQASGPQLPLVFDADGLMADERVDFSGWSGAGGPYRVLREVEAQTVRRAASVIVRTRQAREILLARAGAGTDPTKISVIPNAKDAELFEPRDAAQRERTRARYGVSPSAPWVVYVGSIGPQYELGGMLRLCDSIWQRAAETRVHFFTFDEVGTRSAIEGAARTTGHPIEVHRASPSEVAEVIAAADLGLALRTETFSQRAVCPIKVAEYLLSGVPVVSTRVGDLEQQLAEPNVGFLVSSTASDGVEAAADWFVRRVLADRDGYRRRCRDLGVRQFGLEACAEAYAGAFSRIKN